MLALPRLWQHRSIRPFESLRESFLLYFCASVAKLY